MIKRKSLPSKDRLLEMFDYRDGGLWFADRGSRGFKTMGDYTRWLKRYCGKRAGTVRKRQGESYARRVVCINRFYFHEHRIIFKMHYGYVPDVVDHIDGNPLNNNIFNLREVTARQNSTNSRARKNNSLGVKGVYMCGRKYRAQISVNGKKKHLGNFSDICDAKKAYAVADKEENGTFSHREN